MRRIFMLSLLLVIVAAWFIASPQGHHVLAASHIAFNDACYNNNGGTTNGKRLCNGDDPQTSGCAAGATNAASAYIVNGLGENIGLIELRWSAHCGTNWARATLYIHVGNNLGAAIGYGNVNTCYFSPQDSYSYQSTQYTQIWTSMIFAPTQTAYARGWVGFGHPGDTGSDTCVAG